MPIKPVTKRKKTKKIRYRKVTFKITDSQKKVLDLVSARHKITPNRLIKKAIHEYLEKYADFIAAEAIITKNQLKLFDDEIFEEEETVDIEEE